MDTKNLLQWLKKDSFEYCVVERKGLIAIVKDLRKKEKALEEIACDAGNNCSQCKIDMEIARQALGGGKS